MSVKLYNFWLSSCSWRVRLALALKEIKYEYVAVDLARKGGGEQMSDEFWKVNPMRQVPALVIDGSTFTQSLPIIEYLDERFPEKKLFPNDIKLKARVREVCEVINAGIQPMQNPSVLGQLPEERRKEWAVHFVQTGLVALEKMLEQTAGNYCVGDEITAADIFLVPQIGNANHRFGLDMSQLPIISRIYSTLESHEAFKAAHALNQPDTPAKYSSKV